MLYEIGKSGTLEPVKPPEDTKNELTRGTVLELNGYSNPEYVIIKNLGIPENFSYYGAKYLTVSLEDFNQVQKNAADLEWLHNKKDGRIQTYITDEIKTEEEVLKIWEKSEGVRKEKEAVKKRAAEVKETLINKGRELYKKHIPEGMKALIVAEQHINESDSQSDYFAHSTKEIVILGYSKNTRDLFSEMRKHAVKIPETAHLEKDKYKIYPIIDQDINSNGCYYNKGEKSHWHRDETPEDPFNTEEEAQEYINTHPLYDINFEGVTIPFKWNIKKIEFENRDKHSMGAGYYLKDGWINSTGWAIRKREICESGMEGFYISLAKRCIFGD